ncbi:hypothetical protein [Nonlabens sp.]|uniref:hypothetical protein n=1 Tax=Nonlabens sp. TaxID=1888209 RepID=UPI0025EFAC00|nr:hypothetical protein [Nonlabens sp.]
METSKEMLCNSIMHFEHQLWMGELAFWKDELKFFKNRLSEIVTRWTNKEVLAQLEHYQNEFILHGGVIEDLQETIEEHENRIAAQSKMSRELMDIQLAKRHMEFRDRLETQRHIYAELKKDFFKFLENYR